MSHQTHPGQGQSNPQSRTVLRGRGSAKTGTAPAIHCAGARWQALSAVRHAIPVSEPPRKCGVQPCQCNIEIFIVPTGILSPAWAAVMGSSRQVVVSHLLRQWRTLGDGEPSMSPHRSSWRFVEALWVCAAGQPEPCCGHKEQHAHDSGSSPQWHA